MAVNLEGADQLAGEALSRNPNDLAARAVKDLIAKKASGLRFRPAAGVVVNALPPLVAAKRAI